MSVLLGLDAASQGMWFLLECDAASQGMWFPTFRVSLVVSS